MKSEDVSRIELIIIESLPDNETKTGYNLFSSTIKYKTFQEPNLNSKFYDIQSKKEMFAVLNELIDKALSQNHFFFIHFEVHGYDDGIQIKNREKISWGELIPYFRKINVHFRNLLSIYFAVCKSANIITHINPEKRAPFKFIVTSPNNISVSSITNGFEKFYEHFFFSFDIEAALDSYNSIITNSKDKLILVSSDYCFDQITNIDRSTANKNVLVKQYKDILLKRNILFKYFTDRQLSEIAENELRRDFDELKSNSSYFKMLDLR